MKFYAERQAPVADAANHLRLPLAGYLGGIDSERRIAWPAGPTFPKRTALQNKIGSTRWDVFNQT